MSTPLRRKQQPDPVAEVSAQLATLVESLVELVTARVAATVPAQQSYQPRAAYSIKEFAALLGVNYFTVRKKVADTPPEIRSFKVNGEYRIPHAELERLLSCEGESA